MLDRHADRPLYQQLADALRERILTGAWPPDTELPTDAALEDAFNVGRDTVRDATDVLRHEGLIESRQGKPSIVRPRQPLRTIQLPSHTTIQARMPTPIERRRWALPAGVPVLVVHHANNQQLYPADRVELATDTN